MMIFVSARLSLAVLLFCVRYPTASRFLGVGNKKGENQDRFYRDLINKADRDCESLSV